MNDLPRTTRRLTSLVGESGELRLTLSTAQLRPPGPDEVVVRVEAAPVNPSDMVLLLAFADPAGATVAGDGADAVVTAAVPRGAMAGMAARLGKALPVGNEGAGTVVSAGASSAAQALLGSVVGFAGGGSFAQHRVVHAGQCLPVGDGVTATQAASWFVNPMTALAMVETMRAEGHRALVHTVGASNLGRMLDRICRSDSVPLVQIVRRAEQVDQLRAEGATHVLDSGAESFGDALTDACAATGATLAFDAIGGGGLAEHVLRAMERALLRSATVYSPYGSEILKQVYVYGGLDRGPTELRRTYGMAWAVGGWLVGPRLAGFGETTVGRLRQRVSDELTTTFASSYAEEVPLAAMLDPDVLARCAAHGSGEKVLIRPQL